MRIGIIGTNWGRMHVGGFRGAGAEVVGVCGKDEGHTLEVARAEGIPLATTRVMELCAAADVVVVASPDALHVPHASEALNAGRHVLVEKPLAPRVEDAQALAAWARTLAPGQVAAINFPYRFLPPLSALKAWLASRSPPRALDVTVANSFLPEDDGNREGPLEGPTGDFGGASHVLDTALWLLGGEPEWVSAVLNGRPAHGLSLQARMDSGALLTVTHRPSRTPGIHGRWSLRGHGWEVDFDGGYVPALNGWRIGPARAVVGDAGQEVGPRVEPHPGQREPWAQAHVETARALMERIRGGEARNLATLDDGARVQRLLDAAARSEREGRRVPFGGR
ncbi:MAG TPA: Gfo/Idh/MocA family oxidoreductase [Myxococcaceae bacterium]|nr:Gfo/Idh/MocA family oxidoreductase [Myxococcaceae bacterium]